MDLEINEETISNIITSSQIFQIKQQVLAYKNIIKGLPIPKEIEKNMVQISKDQWENEKEKLFQRSVKFYKEKIEKNNDLMELLNNKLEKRIDEKVDSYVDTHFNGNNNEIIHKNIEKRIAQIENILKMRILDEESRLKFVSELNFLKYKDIYVKLKEDVLGKINKEEDLPFKLYEKSFFSLSKYKRERSQKRPDVFSYFL